jgi:hypothetical protein
MKNITITILISICALFYSSKISRANGDIVFCNQSTDELYVSVAAQWSLIRRLSDADSLGFSKRDESESL